MEWLAGDEDLSQNAATISNAFEVLRRPNSKPHAVQGVGKVLQRRSKGGSANVEEIDSDDGGMQEAHEGISGGWVFNT